MTEIFVGILILAMVSVLYYMSTSFFEAMEQESTRRKELEKNYPQEKRDAPSSSAMPHTAAQIKQRNPAVIIILSIITLGIYTIYWTVKTKEEINSFGASIPTVWLLVVPIVNIYFVYRYAEDFSVYIKKDGSPFLWFLLYLVIAPIFMIFVQIGLNKYASGQQN